MFLNIELQHDTCGASMVNSDYIWMQTYISKDIFIYYAQGKSCP